MMHDAVIKIGGGLGFQPFGSEKEKTREEGIESFATHFFRVNPWTFPPLTVPPRDVVKMTFLRRILSHACHVIVLLI